MQRIRLVAVALAAGLLVTSCGERPVPTEHAPQFARTGVGSAGDAILAMMEGVNAALASQSAAYRVAVAEYITPSDGDEAGATIIARNLGNKWLGADFVPFDPRRSGWSGTGTNDDITFAIDGIDATPPYGGLSGAQTTAAIERAMGTWEEQICSTIPLTFASNQGLDLGFVAWLNGLGGSDAIVADIMHTGWTDINFTGGVLGATFTFVWVNNGVPTDIDRNGFQDVAFREIYYDPSWYWRIDADIDVESIALHEAGHGLSQAHFGNLFIRNDGRYDASPRAVMNALYPSPLQTLLGSDVAGHCSNWARWPQE